MTFNTESLENGTESEERTGVGADSSGIRRVERDLCRREQEGENGSKPRNDSILR